MNNEKTISSTITLGAPNEKNYSFSLNSLHMGNTLNSQEKQDLLMKYLFLLQNKFNSDIIIYCDLNMPIEKAKHLKKFI